VNELVAAPAPPLVAEVAGELPVKNITEAAMARLTTNEMPMLDFPLFPD